jgi:toxin HigB-1
MFAIVGSVCVRRPGNGALRISTVDKCHDPTSSMIRSFAEPRIEKFFHHGICPARWRALENIAKRKLDMLDASTKLSDVRSPPSNRLEVRGDRMELHHEQFRVSFRWTNQGPTEVEIVGR